MLEIMSKEHVSAAFIRGEVLSRLRVAGLSDVEVEIHRVDTEGATSNWKAVVTSPIGQRGRAATNLIVRQIQPELREKYDLETD
jgi:hypothetical protein